MKNENKTNTFSIIGFCLSFIFNIIPIVISTIALNQIKESGEKGRGLAIAGIIISTIKLITIVLLFILLIIGTYKMVESVTDNNICDRAINCKYDPQTDKNTCIIIDDSGEEESIECPSSINYFYGTDGDIEDSFDYDREN